MLLRRIVLDCALTEELKWGVPVYMFQKKILYYFINLNPIVPLIFLKARC